MSEDKWIKCEDRMPEKSVTVCARCRNFVPYTAYHVDGIWYDYQENDRGPTHWMPLPPFKEDE
jgi:hypothetical protein